MKNKNINPDYPNRNLIHSGYEVPLLSGDGTTKILRDILSGTPQS